MKTKLYNVIFPIWFLIIFPSFWLIALPANFIIDSLVLLISLLIFKQTCKKVIYFKTILKIWLFGFLADIIGVIIPFITLMLPSNDVTTAIAMNCFSNIWAFLIMLLSVAISGICIYFFNYKFSFKKIDMTDKRKKQIALIFAIVTAPYLFFMPTQWLYKDYSVNNNNTQKYVSYVENETIICSLVD